MLISVYAASADKNTVLGTNGIVLDRFCLNAVVTQEHANGNSMLDCTFAHDKETVLTANITNNAILKVKLDYGDEVFRITKLDVTTKDIICVAQQITIKDLNVAYLEDVRPINTSPISFLDYCYKNSFGTNKEISFFTDLTGTTTSYFNNKTVYEAFWDSDNSFLNKFGGETKRNNYNVYINKKIGVDNNVYIREGVNLQGFKSSTNTDSLITRVLGEGYNGIKGDWQVSENASKYPFTESRIIKYNVRVREEGEEEQEGYVYFDTAAEAKQELNRLAKLEFTVNNVDKIQATYNINFVMLEQTEEYKDYVQVTRINIGDFVNVLVNSLNINVKVRLVARKYNVLLQRVIDATLSNVAVSSISINKVIDSFADVIAENGGNLGAYIESILSAGMKDSYVVIRPNEFLVMDSKDINTARNVWRWNKGALAHSNEGYYSKNWNIGITQNGEINADLIRVGTLIGIIIKSKDNSTVIDLESGKIKFTKGLIEGANSSWDLDSGKIFTSGTFSGKPVNVSILDGTISSSNELFLIADSEINLLSQYGQDEKNRNLISMGSNHVDIISQATLNLTGKDVIIGEKITGFGSFNMMGDLYVSGNKNCIQTTEKFGDRLFYSVEDAESYLTYRTNSIINTKENKEIKIYINEVFKECVNTEIDYIVEVHKYTFGDYYIKEQTKDYFIIETDRENFKFKYTIVAKRRGFEENNMNLFLKN